MTQEQVNPEVEEVTPETEETTPEPEDLQKQLAALQEQTRQLEENWKVAQRDSSKKNLENQRLREQLARNESQEAMLQALIAVVAQQQQKSPEDLEGEVKRQQPDLVKQYQSIRDNLTKERQKTELTAKIRDIQDRTEALGLKPDNDDYEVIRAFAEAGQFDKAERRLAKLESAKETKPPEPKETEEQRIERLAAEKAKQMLGDRLKQDSGSPAGGGKRVTVAQIENMSDKEIIQFQKEHGGKSVLQLIQEGVVKQK